MIGDYVRWHGTLSRIEDEWAGWLVIKVSGRHGLHSVEMLSEHVTSLHLQVVRDLPDWMKVVDVAG